MFYNCQFKTYDAKRSPVERQAKPRRTSLLRRRAARLTIRVGPFCLTYVSIRVRISVTLALGSLPFAFFTLIENPWEQYPGQFRNILQRPGTIAPPQNITDRLNRGIDRLLAVKFLAVTALILGEVIL